MARFLSPESAAEYRRKMEIIKENRLAAVAEAVRLALPESNDPFMKKIELAGRAERMFSVVDDLDEKTQNYFLKDGRVAKYVRGQWPDIKDHLAVERGVRIEHFTGCGGPGKTDGGVRRARREEQTKQSVGFEQKVLTGSVEHHNTRVEAAPKHYELRPILLKLLKAVEAL